MKFEQDGFLSPGFYPISPEEFIRVFCESSEERREFLKTTTDMFDFAKARGATRLFIGGSFVTQNPSPDDLDTIMVFSQAEQIPHKPEDVLVGSAKLDILFCLENERKTLDALVAMLSKNRNGKGVGVIQVNFSGDNSSWTIQHYPDDATLEIVKRAYSHRAILETNSPKGVLVTVHGILSNAEWNFDLAPIASSQGWVIAPFSYGWTSPHVLLWPRRRRQILEKFRSWIYEIQERHPKLPISVIAHSFGTYLIGAYLEGFRSSASPVTFNSLIFTGSILREDFDWDAHEKSVGIVRNETGLDDWWVAKMPKFSYPGKDKLFGQSGVAGFRGKSKILEQAETEVLGHNNSIQRDIIIPRWMPFLNAHKNIHYDLQKRWARP